MSDHGTIGYMSWYGCDDCAQAMPVDGDCPMTESDLSIIGDSIVCELYEKEQEGDVAS